MGKGWFLGACALVTISSCSAPQTAEEVEGAIALHVRAIQQARHVQEAPKRVEAKFDHMVELLGLVAVHGDRLSGSARDDVMQACKELITDKDVYRTHDDDIVIGVNQLVGMALAFLGDATGKELLLHIEPNTAAFPDVAGYALIWLNDPGGVGLLFERITRGGYCTVSALPYAQLLIAKADPKLRQMRDKTNDPEVRARISAILDAHRRMRRSKR